MTPVSNVESIAAATANNPPRVRTRALLLVNRKARLGRSLPAAALDRLTRAGFELIEECVDRRELMSQAVRAYRDRADAVVIGGGDGTLSAAADGLVEAQLPLGIIPLGTANDLARTLGLPTDPVAAADVICQRHLRRIDLGWVNGTHFFNIASVGLGTRISRALGHKEKGRWGVLAYLFAAARIVIRARPFIADIRTAEEMIRVRTIQVAVANGRHYGGGLTVDETARIDDGVLRLLSLEFERWWQIIPLLPGLRHGTLGGTKHARLLQGREFEVRPRKRRKKVTADGEPAGWAPALFRVVPKAISVFAPGPESAPSQ